MWWCYEGEVDRPGFSTNNDVESHNTFHVVGDLGAGGYKLNAIHLIFT